MSYLVTGAAGFIGFHVTQALLQRGESVWGVDSLNDYYERALKEARLALLQKHRTFTFKQLNIADGEVLHDVFSQSRPKKVIHLAAQAGVQYSVTHPESYVESNLQGFARVLECCHHHQIAHLVFASTSSVYGSSLDMPFRESMPLGHPLSFYAATKISNEAMAHAYAHIRQLPCTGLRFFTVYGPWGRPDMALFKFTKALLADQPLDLYNQGRMKRDFTYIDDIVSAVLPIVDRPASVAPEALPTDPHCSASAPYRLYNVGRGAPVELLRYVATLEQVTGQKARHNLLPMHPGDVPATWADVALLAQEFGYRPKVDVEEGVGHFWQWYRQYYNV